MRALIALLLSAVVAGSLEWKMPDAKVITIEASTNLVDWYPVLTMRSQTSLSNCVWTFTPQPEPDKLFLKFCIPDEGYELWDIHFLISP